MDHANSAIFQRNHLSRMIRYDTQAAYRGTASRAELIRAAHRMSRLIDPRRPKAPTDEQRQNLRRDAEIQQLCDRRDELYKNIRGDFQFIYRAQGEPVHDEYEETKRAIERLCKAREQELKKQVQAEYDPAAPVQDIRAQLAGTEDSVDPIRLTLGPFQHVFAERSRIATAVFNPPLAASGDGDVDWRISIVDNMVSLCTRQECQYRKPPRSRKTQLAGNPRDDADTKPVKSESNDSESSVGDLLPLRCQPYQCLHCLGDVRLPLHERQRNLGSKYSLWRHFARHHPFQPGKSCPFPTAECAQVMLDSVLHFKNHAATVHAIYMSEKD